MASIRSKNTKPELLVRSLLHRMGYRFRIHRKDLPGTPDIVLPKHESVVLVNSCFFHRHSACKYSTTPKTSVEFCARKFARNVERDTRVSAELAAQGWKVVVVWECELRALSELRRRLTAELAAPSPPKAC